MSNSEPSCLRAGDIRIPLRGVTIDIRATGVASRVTVAQRYQNEERVPVEAVYSFPLEDTAAVCAFEAEIDGRRVTGRVEEKDRAFERYDEALSDGHGAFLLDQDRPNIFTASVGNLAPGQEVVLRLSYVTMLAQSGDELRLLVPTTISPRYVPPTQARTMDPAELDHINPPAVLGGVPYGLRLTADIEAQGAIDAVECPSHPVRMQVRERTAHVELMGDDIQLDRDFVLTVKLREPHRPTAVVARDGTDRVAMLQLFPDLGAFGRSPSEVVFFVDRSGSMGGPSIDQARNALLLCLRSLDEGDRFDIVGFGSTWQSLFSGTVAYDQQSLDQATRHASRMQADLGGTELYEALRAVLDREPAGGLPRQLVVLTDGQVSNEAACIALAGQHASTTRIFTFGVGHGASVHLVRGLAKATGGEMELIHPNERIEPKVLRQFRRVASPALRDVKVEWGDLEVDLVAPKRPPVLFDGDRVTLFGRILRGSATEVAITAQGPAGPLRFAVTVDPELATDDPAVPILMARTAISELETELEGGESSGSRQSGRKDGAARRRIAELGVRYGLMSSETSFVAIEERSADQRTTGAELRRIPVALTKGWHGVQEGVGSKTMAGFVGGPPAMSMGMAPPAPMPQAAPAPKRGGGIFAAASSLFSRKRSAPRYEAEEECDERTASLSMPPEPAGGYGGGSDALIDLILLQRADGSFAPEATLLSAAEIDIARLREVAAELPLPRAEAEAVVATLVALHVLRTVHDARRDEWEALADKAERWLRARNVAAPSGARDLHAWVDSRVFSPVP